MAIITLKDVSKKFKIGSEDVTVLQPTSLTINQAEFVAIVGPSGSGKSTLLTVIGALQQPTQGSVGLRGQDLTKKSERDLADLRFDEIGFVLQASNLVPYLTVKEQFELKYTYKKEKINHERIDSLLMKLGINEIKDNYPEEISGGQRQRVAIGAALLLEPSIILADEPTASLDTTTAFEVVDILQEISQNDQTTIVMVTHDTRMLSYCDRVLEIKDGVISETKAI